MNKDRTEPDISIAHKSGHFDLLTTSETEAGHPRGGKARLVARIASENVRLPPPLSGVAVWVIPARADCPALIEEHNAEERRMDGQPAVVVNVAQFSELVHERIHARPRGTYHFGQHLLADFRNDSLGFAFLAILS